MLLPVMLPLATTDPVTDALPALTLPVAFILLLLVTLPPVLITPLVNKLPPVTLPTALTVVVTFNGDDTEPLRLSVAPRNCVTACTVSAVIPPPTLTVPEVTRFPPTTLPVDVTDAACTLPVATMFCVAMTLAACMLPVAVTAVASSTPTTKLP